MLLRGVPEIRRAWATVDNALFSGVSTSPTTSVECSGEEPAIVSVGLAKANPAFSSLVERVLVGDDVEVVLLGVAFDQTATATAPPTVARPRTISAHLTLHALNYACTTDDVVVKDIASTESGRIFFAGDDEALYEVEYSGSDTWRARRCRKVCHHSAMPKLLPSILRLRAPDPLRQVLVDEYRCTLYTRSEGGAVNVFDLGPGCAETPAEWRRFATSRRRAHGARGWFILRRRGRYGGHGGFNAGGSSGAAAANRSQRGRRLVHIALVSPAESTTVTLVAVRTDGGCTSRPRGGGAWGPGMAARRRRRRRRRTPTDTRRPARGGGAQVERRVVSCPRRRVWPSWRVASLSRRVRAARHDVRAGASRDDDGASSRG